MGFAMTVRFLSPASGEDYKEEWQSAKKNRHFACQSKDIGQKS